MSTTTTTTTAAADDVSSSLLLSSPAVNLNNNAGAGVRQTLESFTVPLPLDRHSQQQRHLLCSLSSSFTTKNNNGTNNRHLGSRLSLIGGSNSHCRRRTQPLLKRSGSSSISDSTSRQSSFGSSTAGSLSSSSSFSSSSSGRGNNINGNSNGNVRHNGDYYDKQQYPPLLPPHFLLAEPVRTRRRTSELWTLQLWPAIATLLRARSNRGMNQHYRRIVFTSSMHNVCREFNRTTENIKVELVEVQAQVEEDEEEEQDKNKTNDDQKGKRSGRSSSSSSLSSSVLLSAFSKNSGNPGNKTKPSYSLQVSRLSGIAASVRNAPSCMAEIPQIGTSDIPAVAELMRMTEVTTTDDGTDDADAMVASSPNIGMSNGRFSTNTPTNHNNNSNANTTMAAAVVMEIVGRDGYQQAPLEMEQERRQQQRQRQRQQYYQNHVRNRTTTTDNGHDSFRFDATSSSSLLWVPEDSSIAFLSSTDTASSCMYETATAMPPLAAAVVPMLTTGTATLPTFDTEATTTTTAFVAIAEVDPAITSDAVTAQNNDDDDVAEAVLLDAPTTTATSPLFAVEAMDAALPVQAMPTRSATAAAAATSNE